MKRDQSKTPGARWLGRFEVDALGEFVAEGPLRQE